jgi:hypothetical protein
VFRRLVAVGCADIHNYIAESELLADELGDVFGRGWHVSNFPPLCGGDKAPNVTRTIYYRNIATANIEAVFGEHGSCSSLAFSVTTIHVSGYSK